MVRHLLVYYNGGDIDRDKSTFSEDENLIGCMGCSGRGIRGLDLSSEPAENKPFNCWAYRAHSYYVMSRGTVLAA